MDSEPIKVLEGKEAQHKKSIYFSEGLPAFENVHEFVIITNEDEAPFLWLQAVSIPNLAFVTIDPFLVYPGYRPDISENDVKALQIEGEEDVLILSIVTINNQSDEGVVANLVGPIVINWKKRLGRQVILQNHQKYQVKYRIDNLSQEK